MCTCIDFQMCCHSGASKEVQNTEEASTVSLSKFHLYMGDRVSLPGLEGGLLEIAGGGAVCMCGAHMAGTANYFLINDTLTTLL